MLCLCSVFAALHIIHGFENIALNKPTYQSNEFEHSGSPTGTFDSSNAVDGLKDNLSAFGGQCVISKDGFNESTWWVNLTSIYSIHAIRIYYRTDNAPWDPTNGYTARFLGFSVYVSNTTNRLDGYMCFHDTIYSNATIPAIANITCSVYGQYVIYYNHRPQSSIYSDQYSPFAHNELCEVEVYGCKKRGYYGLNCSIPCPVNCQNISCNMITGNCFGCKPGYQGNQCTTPCNHSFYGVSCSLKCGNCSDGVTCHHVNGSCTNGCDVGVYGDKCEMVCPKNQYGKNCSKACSNCDTCDRFSGQCTSLCKAGWEGLYCTEKCQNYTYGEGCKNICGACKDQNQCHHINGSCFEGCDAGYQGEVCKTECVNGTFGQNCEKNCSDNCLEPYKCKTITGECEKGCKPGWSGLKCHLECTNKRYGINCSRQCGNCINSVNCNHIDGTCPEGCSRGYTNKDCKTECRSGTYDFECKKNCSTQCFNDTCNPINGSCIKITGSPMKINTNDDLGAVVGGVSGLVGVCLVGVIVIIILRRRRHQKNNNVDGQKTGRPKVPKMRVFETTFSTIDSTPSSSSERENDRNKRNVEKPSTRHELHVEPDLDDDEKIHAENPYGDFYANETIIRDISINDLENIIAEKRMNDDDGFQREYATLPYGERYKCDAGKRQENLIKNRYKTTFPYDHSIVKLRSPTGSDYINANYIEGAQNDKQYIAAQGPKQNTVADFWTMVWQEHVKTIVILTNLKEGNKTKCTQYWPDANKHTNYGIVSVKTVEEKMYAFYNIRKLTVNHKETKTSRVVTQFHYTTWPDHGTPDPLCLIVFLDHVTRTGSYQNSPTLVHCSAGIGRTGTYIAIDVLYQIGSKTRRINVAQYVKKMRKNRMNMVQTYEQYMTIFLALNEIFKSTVKTISIEDFTKKSGTMTKDEPANQSVLRKEFQLLMKIRPVYNDDAYKLAREVCGGICSNSLLPLDKYSVHLSSVVPKRGQFINAISVPSYTSSRAFIVTQYPTTEDAVDFLRLLNDHESDTVICMDPMNKIDSGKAWFPNPSSFKTMKPFTVHFQSKSENDVIVTTVHILEKNNEEEAHPVTIIEPKVSIKTSGIALDTSQLRSLVSSTLNIETENPITIVSSDGAALCGVFCAVHNVLQQINTDGCVDVFTAVRQLQVRRPEFCSNLDEYRLVIKAVYDHIQSIDTSIYYNQ